MNELASDNYKETENYNLGWCQGSSEAVKDQVRLGIVGLLLCDPATDALRMSAV
jgi:hypothetical protein